MSRETIYKAYQQYTNDLTTSMMGQSLMQKWHQIVGCLLGSHNDNIYIYMDIFVNIIDGFTWHLEEIALCFKDKSFVITLSNILEDWC